MTPRNWTNIFKTADGGYDVNRFVGVIGALVYIVCAQVVAFITKAGLAEYCIAFPGGMVALGLGTAGAVAIKDRQVAKAKAEAEGTQL